MNVEIVYNALLAASVRAVVAMPDSLLSPLCARLRLGTAITYVQTCSETVCVGLASGINLTGSRALILMENSGLRSACESIARMHLSHHIFACYLVSHRGALGERNWWGQAHDDTMEPLLHLLRFRWTWVPTIDAFPSLLMSAYASLEAQQCSTMLVAEAPFLEALRL